MCWGTNLLIWMGFIQELENFPLLITMLKNNYCRGDLFFGNIFMTILTLFKIKKSAAIGTLRQVLQDPRQTRRSTAIRDTTDNELFYNIFIAVANSSDFCRSSRFSHNPTPTPWSKQEGSNEPWLVSTTFSLICFGQTIYINCLRLEIVGSGLSGFLSLLLCISRDSRLSLTLPQKSFFVPKLDRMAGFALCFLAPSQLDLWPVPLSARRLCGPALFLGHQHSSALLDLSDLDKSVSHFRHRLVASPHMFQSDS